MSKIYFETDLQNYNSFIVVSNALEWFIGIIIIFIIVYATIKIIKSIHKQESSNFFLKYFFVILFVIILYSLGEYIRGNKTLKDYIDNNNTYIIDGKISKLKKTIVKAGVNKVFYVNKVFFSVLDSKIYYENSPFFKEDFYKKDKAIKHNGQHIKIEYIKVPAGKICTPFFKYCKYSKEIKNKIIKLWIYDK